MEWQDYIEATQANALEFIEENYEFYDSYSELMDDMMDDDSVTGNASGSFTMNRAQAEENVQGIIFNPNVVQEFKALGYDGIPTEKGAEAVDVIARCIAIMYAHGLRGRFAELKNAE